MEKRLTKDEAKEKLRRAKIDLRVAEIISEEHEKAIKEIKEDIEKLKAIINKKDNWRLVEVSYNWRELYEEKALLMADMMHFAYVKNGVSTITISGTMKDYDGYIYAWTLYMNSAGIRAFAFTDSKLNTVKLHLKDL